MKKSDPAGVVVRAATVLDLPSLRDLAYRSKAVWGYNQAFMDAVRPALAPTESNLSEGVFILECDGWPAGFYGFKAMAGSLFLDCLFVAPPHIGNGYGKRLWDHAAGFARRLSHSHFMIESDPNGEGFYLRMGATRVGEITSAASGRTLPLLRFDCGP